MATHTLTLQRLKEYQNVKGTGSASSKPIENATIGKVTLTDEAGKEIMSCFSCENGGESTDTPKQDKRIVARTYQLRWSSSGVNGGCTKAYPKWLKDSKDCPVKITDGTTGKNIVLWTVSSEKKEHAGRRIHIHSGNCPQHTEACPLFGYVDNKNGTIADSARAINDLYTHIAGIGVENVDFVVKEIQ